MDKVRLNLVNMQAHDLSAFLFYFCELNTPERVRLNTPSTKPSERAIIKMVSALCARLRLRIAKAQLLVKNEYRITVPAEEALALVVAWTTCTNKSMRATCEMVQQIVGEIDQALA